ncbi:MAG: Obg family GTPase CgtA, partial [Oscillospiraceae bacterium]|nr:Obg family GTPase CgtA [Oscillospiraceae bacterium]
ELGSDEPTIESDEGYWTVDGGWVDMLVQNTNFTDYESRMHFDRVMRARGLFDKLEEMGIAEGDTVNVCGLEFEYKR